MSRPSQAFSSSEELADSPVAPEWSTFVSTTEAAGAARYRASIAVLAVLTVGLSFAAAAWTPAGATNAVWWPAAGTAAVLALVIRGRIWPVVALAAVAASVANVAAGRPPVYAVWGAVLITVFLVAFHLTLHVRGRLRRLSTIVELRRFLVAALLATSAIGAMGAIAFAVVLGQPPGVGFLFFFSGHLSATVLIVPIALVPSTLGPVRHIEEWVTFALLLAVLLIAFGPLRTEAVSALLFPLLAWSAMRSRPLLAVVTVLVIGITVPFLTVLGGGPFSAVGSTPVNSALVQLFLLSLAITVLVISAVRSERAALLLSATRRSELLEGGFIASQVGLAIVRASQDATPHIVEANELAATLLEIDEVRRIVTTWLTSSEAARSQTVELPDGRSIQVLARPVTAISHESLLGVQLVDVTQSVAARSSLEALLEEQRQLAVRRESLISRVSHELRTPLTAILGFTEILEESARSDQRGELAIVTRNAHRLQQLIESLLEGSAAAAERTGPVDLRSLVGQIEPSLGEGAASRAITVVLDTEPRPAIVTAPEDRLAALVSRISERALVVAMAGSTMTLSVRSTAHSVRLSITLDQALAHPAGSIALLEDLPDDTESRSPGAVSEPIGPHEAYAHTLGAHLTIPGPDALPAVHFDFERSTIRS